MVQRTASVLTIDIGSSSCKSVLFDAVGNIVFSSSASYSLQTQKQGWVEQDSHEIWQGVCSAIKQLKDALTDSVEIASISISSQISSYFLVDAKGNALTPVISWMDTRAKAESEEMKQAFSSDELMDMLGVHIPIGPAWIVPKLRWMSKHMPEMVHKAKYIIQLKEWVIWNLTGEWISDVTSYKGIVHQGTNEIATKLIEWAGGRSDMIPTRLLPYEIAGTLTNKSAQYLGLPHHIPVIVGWNDMNAAVLGMLGVPEEPIGFDLTGTSEHIGFVQRTKPGNQPAIHSGINLMPFGDQHQVYYGVTSSGGQALQWFVEQIDQYGAVDSRQHLNYESALSLAELATPGSEGVIFLPYIHGERSPWWNPDARGVFFGLHAKHHRGHMARAVLEGVGFALRSIIDCLPAMPSQMIVAGGSSRIPLWNQIKSDIIGKPYRRLETAEAGCLGAAILSAYALGWYSSLQDASEKMIRTAEVYEPREEYRSMYEDRYQKFLSLYRALVPMF